MFGSDPWLDFDAVNSESDVVERIDIARDQRAGPRSKWVCGEQRYRRRCNNQATKGATTIREQGPEPLEFWQLRGSLYSQ